MSHFMNINSFKLSNKHIKNHILMNSAHQRHIVIVLIEVHFWNTKHYL